MVRAGELVRVVVGIAGSSILVGVDQLDAAVGVVAGRRGAAEFIASENSRPPLAPGGGRRGGTGRMDELGEAAAGVVLVKSVGDEVRGGGAGGAGGACGL